MIYAVNIHNKEHRVAERGTGWSERWRLVQATPDGWIPHNGNDQPLPDGVLCEVRSYRGQIVGPTLSDAEIWTNKGRVFDIASYRPILNADTKVSHPGTMAGPDKYRADGGEWPAWDGEGDKPPVESRCMKGHAEVLVIAHANVGSLYDPAVVYQPINHPMGIDWKVSNVFSPIRSEEDRAVEEMAGIIMDVPADRDDRQDSTNIARALYRAGYRKTGGEG